MGEELRLRVGRRGANGLGLDELVAETGVEAAALGRWAAPLLSAGTLLGLGGRQREPELLLTREAMQEAEERLLRELGRSKEKRGTQAELRSRARLSVPVFALALRQLAAAGRIAVEGEAISVGGAPAPVGDRRLGAVEAMYAQAGLASPLLSEVSERLKIAPKDLHGLTTTLLRAKRLVRLGADNLLVDAGALEQLVETLRRRRGESFDVGRFKSFTGLTRKHAIPLLEYLDGARVTRNQSGTRIVL